MCFRSNGVGAVVDFAGTYRVGGVSAFWEWFLEWHLSGGGVDVEEPARLLVSQQTVLDNVLEGGQGGKRKETMQLQPSLQHYKSQS